MRRASDVWLRALAGAGELAAPTLAARVGWSWDEPVTRASRILGMRNVTESVILWNKPGPHLRRVLATVDGIHALSMVIYAVARPDRAMPCLISAAVAIGTGFASSTAAH